MIPNNQSSPPKVDCKIDLSIRMNMAVNTCYNHYNIKGRMEMAFTI